MLRRMEKLFAKREVSRAKLGRLNGGLQKVAAAAQRLGERRKKLELERVAAANALDLVERELNEIMAEAQKVIESTAAAAEAKGPK